MASFLMLFSVAFAETPIRCNTEQECSDPCAYFPEKTIFREYFDEKGYKTAKLRFRGKVVALKEVSTKNLKKKQEYDDLPGDVTQTEYSANDMKVILTKTTLNTSCYSQALNGTWESEGKCCWTSYKLKLRLIRSTGEKTLTTNWDSGC